jgi:hypothetical protein
MLAYAVLQLGNPAFVEAAPRVAARFYEVGEPGWTPVDQVPTDGCVVISSDSAPLLGVGAGELTLSSEGVRGFSLEPAPPDCADTGVPCAFGPYEGDWRSDAPWGADIHVSATGDGFMPFELTPAARMPSAPMRILAPDDEDTLPVPFSVRWGPASDGSRTVIYLTATDAPSRTLACAPDSHVRLNVDDELLSLFGARPAGLSIQVERQQVALHTLADDVGLRFVAYASDGVRIALR